MRFGHAIDISLPSMVGGKRYLLDGVGKGAAIALASERLKGSWDYLGTPLLALNVRRSSDNADAWFTHPQWKDGTLLAWVNEDVAMNPFIATTGDVWAGALYDTFTGDGYNGFSASDAATSGRADLFVGKAATGQKWTTGIQIQVTFTATLTSGAVPTFFGVRSGVPQTNTHTVTAGANSVVLTVTAADYIDSLRFNTASAATYSITGFTVTQLTANGHVVTWVDQSGNARHATQPTAGNQPKVVNAGSLVVNANGNPAISFAGSAFMTVTLARSGTETAFLVAQTPSAFSTFNTLWSGDAGDITARNVIRLNPNITTLEFLNISGGITRTVAASTQYVIYARNGASLNLNLGVNGGELASGTGSSVSANDVCIGRDNATGLKTRYWAGAVSAAILFTSDNSAQRAVIEQSLAKTYGITLA